MNSSFVLSLLFLTSFLNAQKNISVHFSPRINNEVVELSKKYFSPFYNDSIQIDVFKCYISNISLLHDNQVSYTSEKKYYLIDLELPKSLSLNLNIPTATIFNSIQFEIGVDSLTNVSGVQGGDLDPMKGMYWTWQSGYINFKLEGSSNVCKTRKNKFQWHIGGFQFPYSTVQFLQFKTKQKGNIHIHIHIDELLNTFNLTDTNQVMSPNETAVKISRFFNEIFMLSQ